MRAAAAPETDAPALPPLFRHHIRRPRLTRLLDASTSPIIVLAAPAGYGKTTLAAEWLQGRPKSEVAWYYASSASADVAALSVGIAEAVSHILPAGDRVRQRLRVPQVPDNAADILAELLAGDLMEWPENAWLVVDDYHHAMESKSAERFVEELVRLAPIRILITTRRRPTWVTARRVVYGDIVEFTQQQLLMTQNEATAVLAGRKSALEGDERYANETWPALVGLAALSSTAKPRRDELQATVYRYLAEEVLNEAPAAEQRFLLLASLPPYLNREVLGLLAENCSASVAHGLGAQWLWSTDAMGRLRLHPLLREFLLTRALADDSAQAERVARGAADIYLRASDWDAAFQVATDTQLVDLARRVAREAGHSLLQAGRLGTLESWLKVTEDAERIDVDALLLRAQIALRKGSFSRAVGLTRYTIDALAPADPREPAAWNLLGRALHMRCDHRFALKAYENAHRTATTGEDRLQAAWGRLIATVELGQDDPKPCISDFENLASRSPDHRLRLACGKIMAAERAGTRLPLKEYRESLSLVAHAADPMAISNAYAMGIYAHARRGAYSEAIELADRAVQYCASLRLGFPLAYCLAYRSQAEIGVRRLRAARSTLAEVEGHVRSIEDAHLRLVYETLKVKLAIASGQVSFASLNASAQFAVRDAPHWPLADLISVEALVLAARGQIEHVREREDLLENLSHGPTAEISFALANLIARVVSESAEEDLASELRETLTRLVHLQCLDTFVTAYRACPRLLQIEPGDHSLLGLIQRTVAASDDLRLVDDTPSLLGRSPVKSLTRREAEVAALIAAGLTNAEIAAELFIALSTAKVHVHRVLKKLHANSRLEAALAWRDAHAPPMQR